MGEFEDFVREEYLRREQVVSSHFAREAPRLARACHAMAERFARGGRILAFGLGAAAPAGATIDPASGLFSWTPATAPSTNSLSVIVSDNPGGPGSLSATQTFMATVLLPARLDQARLQGNRFSFSWQALAGQSYQVEHKTNLMATNWIPLGGTVTGAGSILSFTNDTASSPEGYYRLRFVP